LAEEAVKIVLLQSERELIGILNAEIDAIGIVQHPAGDAFAIHPSAVAAVEILDDVGSVFKKNLRVVARGAIIAQNQMIIGLPSD
jgi:hypothetical protein